MKNEDLWKIFTTDKSVMILTDVPRNFRNGDGAYFLMKQLQKPQNWQVLIMKKR